MMFLMTCLRDSAAWFLIPGPKASCKVNISTREASPSMVPNNAPYRHTSLPTADCCIVKLVPLELITPEGACLPS